MLRARDLGTMACALSLCMLAHAAETNSASRQIAPPKRIPDVVSPGFTPANIEPEGEPVNTASIPRAVRRAVVADAAKRFEVAESAVVLANAEQVTWSDGALGCPEPGRVYTQMLVAGFRVVATTTAGALTYHTDSRGNVVTCRTQPSKPARVPPGTGDASEPRTPPPSRL